MEELIAALTELIETWGGAIAALYIGVNIIGFVLFLIIFIFIFKEFVKIFKDFDDDFKR